MTRSDTPKTKVAILISGRGSNMAALIEAAKFNDYPAIIALVVSNKENAGGLEIANANGIPTSVVVQTSGKAAFEDSLHRLLTEAGTELICLAGFMKILSANFINKWTGRVINIHPSLLPAFPGLDTHQRALDAGVKEHGCTVHYVTEEVDAGEMIAQKRIRVEDTDNEKTLSERVLEAEHLLYPFALRSVVEKMTAQAQYIQTAS